MPMRDAEKQGGSCGEDVRNLAESGKLVKITELDMGYVDEKVIV
jgi:hypothetical protein